MNKEFKVLIVDDEPDIIEFVSYNLVKAGYKTFQADTGQKAIKIAKEVNPHIILLDIMLPGIDGIEICGQLREIPELKHTLIAFLTARAEDYSQIAAFTAGGDDYIIKPIRPKVLISRIRALLKRFDQSIIPDNFEEEQSSFKQFGNFSIDHEKYLVTVDGEKLYLPNKEFILLQLLTSRPSKVFTREEIFDYIWNGDSLVSDRAIDVYVSKLREKLGENKIKTVKGVGYKFEEYEKV